MLLRLPVGTLPLGVIGDSVLTAWEEDAHGWEFCNKKAHSQGAVLQELIEARKEERKRKRAEGKGRISNAASWDEDEQKVKIEGADSGFGAFENGDGPEHRWVPAILMQRSAALLMLPYGAQLQWSPAGAIYYVRCRG